jgi:hypothetical protein
MYLFSIFNFHDFNGFNVFKRYKFHKLLIKLIIRIFNDEVKLNYKGSI